MPLDAVALPAPRLAPPDRPAGDLHDRRRRRARAHAYGKSYLDIVRGFRGALRRTRPTSSRARATSATSRPCSSGRRRRAPRSSPTAAARASSAASTRACPARFDGVVSLDLGALDARARGRRGLARGAHPGAGARGPAARGAARARTGMTLRFFPQSFEFSTLGGWIATRAGGHFATRLTHIDDLVESVRAITPSGPLGVAPPARLGRRARRPTGCCSARRGSSASSPRRGCGCSRARAHRAGRAVRFDSFLGGAEAVRALAQSGLHPAQLPAASTRTRRAQIGAGDGAHALLVLGFESDRPPGRRAARRAALEICREHGGDAATSRGDDGAARRLARGVPPHALPARHARARSGVLAETFETAITWERFPAFHEARDAGGRREALRRARAASPAASRTSIPTARRRTSPCWRRRAAATRSRSGGRSSARPPTRSSPPAGRSPTTTRSAATTARGTTASARTPFAAALRGAKAAVDPAGHRQPGRADRSVADSGSVSRRTRGSASGGSSGSGPWGPGVSARGPRRSKSAS